MENKKSFLLYCDLIHTVNKLPNDKAGLLFKHILSYVNDENPETDDIVVDIAFEHIKQQLKRDLDKWEVTKENKSNAGRLGNLKRWYPDLYKKVMDNEITIDEAYDIASKTSQTDSNQSHPIANIAVNDNVTVSVNDNVTVINKKEEFKTGVLTHSNKYPNELLNEFISYWTEKSPNGKKMRFEAQKFFDVSKRLTTWQKRNNNYGNKQTEWEQYNISERQHARLKLLYNEDWRNHVEQHRTA